jgi:signal transduction histidine kinase
VSLKIRFLLLCALAALLAGALGVVAFLLTGRQTELNRLINARAQSRQVTQELRDLSDDLTRLARAYVGTGDRKYRTLHDQALAVLKGAQPKPANPTGRIYWDYVLAPDPARLPRTGSVQSPETVFAALGSTADELALLRTALQSAAEIVAIEAQAFSFFDGLYPDETGKATRLGAPDPEQAQRLLHNRAYNEAKLAFATPLEQIDQLLPARLEAALSDHQRTSANLSRLLLILGGALSFVLLAGFAVIHVQMTSPLARLASLSQSMARGNIAVRAPAEAGAEVGLLARSLNQLLDQVHANVTELKLQSAEIDRLKVAVATAQNAVRTAETSTRQMEQELQSANEFKAKLLGLASHNLKAPLAEIETLSEMMVGEVRDQPQFAGQIDRIRTSARTMHALVVDMLELAARDLGQVSLERFSVNAVVLLRDVLDQLTPQARQKQQTISHFHEGDCTLTADARRLRQILDQLIGNAIKFSPRGKPISVVLEGNEDRVRFSVVDEGPGLTENDRERAFGYFQRLSARPTAGEPSTGLGLALCKQLVELHGGRIGVESAGADTGAKFWVELPKTPEPLN